MPLPIVPAPTTPITSLNSSLLLIPESCLPFNRQCHGVSTTETQRNNCTMRIAPLQLIQHSRQQARARLSDRMAQRNRAAVHVHAFGLESELASHRNRRDRKRLVQ